MHVVKKEYLVLEFWKLNPKFFKLFNQRVSHQPSGQHVLNDEYYNRIEAIQYTMNYDDKLLVDVEKSDIILLGGRTSKTPTSIYLANSYKTANIPLVNQNSIPKF